MISFGYKNILSYFEDVSFPIILLKPDLSVEYMNTEAENAFGKYFRKTNWQKEYFERDIERQIKRALEKGENIAVSPPHVKHFSLLVFQPIISPDGKTETVRLSVELLSDTRKHFESDKPNQSLFENIYNEISDTANTMEMAINLLQKESKSEKDKPYYNILERGTAEFKKSAMCLEYLYELMKRNDISKDKLNNPRLEIQEIMESIEGVSYTDLLGDTGMLIYNRSTLEKTLSTITDIIQNLAENEKVKVKAYESDPYFVFIFTAKKHCSLIPDKRHMEELKLSIDIIKQRTEENGGHFIIHEAQNSVKIMFSMKKHLRKDYASMFNQDRLQLRKE